MADPAENKSKSKVENQQPGAWTEEEIEAMDFSDLAPAHALQDPTITREEGFLSAPDGLKIFWQSWSRDAKKQRGAIALMHGYGEHSGRYAHVAGAFVRAGYNVMAIDARGHGRSTGERAHVGRYHDYVSDLAMLKRRIDSTWPELPLFVFGHSNGGLIVLRYALTQPGGVRGFVLSSPLVRIKAEVPAIKAAAGNVMSKVWPSFSMPSGIAPTDVSQNPDVIAQYGTDPLVLDIATARWFTETKAAGADLLARASQLEQPFLFLVAGQDALVDPVVTEKLFHRLGSRERELEIYPNLFHEILNEAVWENIMRRMIRWIELQRTSVSG